MFKILFSAKKAERHPFEMFFVGFFYSSLSLLLSSWIFPGYTSLTMVFFTVISSIYVFQVAIRMEEKKEKDEISEKWLLRHHIKPLSFLLFLFIGFVFSFAFWSFFLPVEKVAVIFSLQDSVVKDIQSITGNAIVGGSFFSIFMNNINVLLISLVLAFFYGAGAIFVLAWNASVMGFVIGTFARNTLGLVSLPVAFTKYFIHGIPEMLAYLVIALAGGILYIAFLRGDLLREGKSKRIIIDSIVLVAISIILLIIAALIEVYISPSF
jgi:stage II sporulation protein M